MKVGGYVGITVHAGIVGIVGEIIGSVINDVVLGLQAFGRAAVE